MWDRLPRAYADAAPGLRWVLRRRLTPTNLLRAAAQGPEGCPIEGPRLGDLVIRLVFEDAISLTYLQARHLHGWRVDRATALADGLRGTLSTPVAVEERGWLRVDGPEVAARLAVPGWWARWGHPVGIAPTPHVLLIGGPEVVREGLRRYADADDVLSPVPFTTDGRPVPAGLATALATARLYDDQAELLADVLPEGVVIAGVSVWGDQTVCRWTPGIPTALPQTDRVEIHGVLHPWREPSGERVAEDPPRYLVR